MLQSIWSNFKGEKRPFVLFDMFECSPCYQIMKLLPGGMQLSSTYKTLRNSLIQPMEGIFQYCQQFLSFCPRPLTRILGYPALFLAFVSYLLNYFQSHIENIEDLHWQYFLIGIHTQLIGYMGATYLLTYFISPGHFNSKEDQEELKLALETKPELKYNDRILCHECNVPRVARSFHCQHCQHCIAKGEYHSDVLNTCIGAGNHPYYIVFLIAVTLTFGFQSWFLSVYRNAGEQRAGLIILLINYKLTVYYFLLLCQHISNAMSNLTFKEIYDARKLPYLWKSLDCQFFNPFDKGAIGNLRELFLVISKSKSIPLSAAEANQYLQVGQDEEKSVMHDQSYKAQREACSDSDSDDEKEEQKSSQTQASKSGEGQEEDEFECIGKNKPIPDKYINWKTKKFFTIVDIPNSPIREIAIFEMKKKMRKLKAASNTPQALLEKELRESSIAGMSAEEIEIKRKTFLERMNKDREAYMRKQIEEQKALFAANPELAERQRIMEENGIMQALRQAKEYPQRAGMIQAEVAVAEKNYAVMFGDSALAAFKDKQAAEETAASGNADSNSSSGTDASKGQQAQPKFVYQPEGSSNNNPSAQNSMNLSYPQHNHL